MSPPSPGIPCGECRSCRKIDRGVHPDIQTFSLASQAATADKSGGKNTGITIETVREVSAAAALRPIEGRWRVSIVDDAETMAEVAQEALLKTLEEPPPSMLLILLADDAEALLPTIRSRCQVIELRPTPRTTIMELLRERGVDPERAGELASLAAGSPGWAIEAAERAALRDERIAAVDEAIAWIGASGYDRLVRAVRNGDGFAKSRQETLGRLGILLAVWRDVLLLVADKRERVTYQAHVDRLAEIGGGWSMDAVFRAVRSVQQCIRDLETNVRPRLAMEAMVLEWPTRMSTPQPATRR